MEKRHRPEAIIVRLRLSPAARPAVAALQTTGGWRNCWVRRLASRLLCAPRAEGAAAGVRMAAGMAAGSACCGRVWPGTIVDGTTAASFSVGSGLGGASRSSVLPA